jgi:hypothetical protein
VHEISITYLLSASCSLQGVKLIERKQLDGPAPASCASANLVPLLMFSNGQMILYSEESSCFIKLHGESSQLRSNLNEYCDLQKYQFDAATATSGAPAREEPAGKNSLPEIATELSKLGRAESRMLSIAHLEVVHLLTEKVCID